MENKFLEELAKVKIVEMDLLERNKGDLIQIQELWFNARKRASNAMMDIEYRTEQGFLTRWIGELMDKKIDDFKYLAIRDKGREEGTKEIVDFMRVLEERKKQFFSKWEKESK